MPFYSRQKIDPPPPMDLGHVEEKVTDDGYVIRRQVADNSPLPDSSLFDLGAMVRAGVNVREVSTRILGGGVAVEDAIDYVNNLPDKE